MKQIKILAVVTIILGSNCLALITLSNENKVEKQLKYTQNAYEQFVETTLETEKKLKIIQTASEQFMGTTLGTCMVQVEQIETFWDTEGKVQTPNEILLMREMTLAEDWIVSCGDLIPEKVELITNTHNNAAKVLKTELESFNEVINK